MHKEIIMVFDVEMELEILQSRLQDVLALECLDREELASANVDLGYINCLLEYNVNPKYSVYEELLASVKGYEEASC